MAASCCPHVTWRFASPQALVASPEPCVWAHALVEAGLVVRGGNLPCEVETCHVRRRLVVRGGDLSCEGSSSGKLVGDAVVRSRTGRLASEGLDEDLHAFPEMRLRVESALLLDVVISKGTTILKLLAG
jgi:hypothetical protein